MREASSGGGARIPCWEATSKSRLVVSATVPVFSEEIVADASSDLVSREVFTAVCGGTGCVGGGPADTWDLGIFIGAGRRSTLCFLTGGRAEDTTSCFTFDTVFCVNLEAEVDKLHVCACRWVMTVWREGKIENEARRSDRRGPMAFAVRKVFDPFRVTDRLKDEISIRDTYSQKWKIHTVPPTHLCPG